MAAVLREIRLPHIDPPPRPGQVSGDSIRGGRSAKNTESTGYHHGSVKSAGLFP
jgi:hypothetical protein